MNNEQAAAIVRQYKKIKNEYAFNPSILDTDDDNVRTIKRVMEKQLTEVERTIFILYLELNSYRKLGAALGCSHQTIKNEVKKIKDKIIKYVH